MGVARIAQVVDALLGGESTTNEDKRREGPAYPPNTPIAIIERASMPDQRVLTSTLENAVMALESCGEQRPPGLMVIGWAVLALWGEGDVDVLEDEGEQAGKEEERLVIRDGHRVKTWLCDQTWRVQEGIDEAWNDLVV
jgi:uroporphyrin-III C-methyltransferase